MKKYSVLSKSLEDKKVKFVSRLVTTLAIFLRKCEFVRVWCGCNTVGPIYIGAAKSIDASLFAAVLLYLKIFFRIFLIIRKFGIF